LLARVVTASVLGIDGVAVEVEVDISFGLPTFHIVGLPGAEIRESRDRIRAALNNNGFEYPARRIVVNLAPATLRKEGASFDLPIAVGMILASGQACAGRAGRYLIIGELSLDGALKRVRGALCMVSCLSSLDLDAVILPRGNALEASVCTEKPVYGADSLVDVMGILKGERKPARAGPPATRDDGAVRGGLDFSDVRGQQHARRAVEIAAAGAHNLLMVGPPGSGKTMIARRVPTILPPMTTAEAIETTKVFSVAGKLNRDGLLSERPFRAPHHTISEPALVGGGLVPRPGEVSLANHGVLFLDEFTEFRRTSLEVLRQPLEDRTVTISRSRATVTFPANFMLVAAMNPCPCGNLTDPSKHCRCSARDVERYRRKISQPLLDRIDIHVEVPPAGYRDLARRADGEASDRIRERVIAARAVQEARFKGLDGVFANSQMGAAGIRAHCRLDEGGEDLLRAASLRLGLSARSYTKVLRIARTIADLAGSKAIEPAYVAEAIQYRVIGTF
jgi:magnesium chelatase family protein